MSSHTDKLQVYVLQTMKCLFVLYGCESLSFTLREECNLRVLENMVLRRIFGPKKEDVTG